MCDAFDAMIVPWVALLAILHCQVEASQGTHHQCPARTWAAEGVLGVYETAPLRTQRGTSRENSST
jgi:hypothetical protein